MNKIYYHFNIIKLLFKKANIHIQRLNFIKLFK